MKSKIDVEHLLAYDKYDQIRKIVNKNQMGEATNKAAKSATIRMMESCETRFALNNEEN